MPKVAPWALSLSLSRSLLPVRRTGTWYIAGPRCSPCCETCCSRGFNPFASPCPSPPNRPTYFFFICNAQTRIRVVIKQAWITPAEHPWPRWFASRSADIRIWRWFGSGQNSIFNLDSPRDRATPVFRPVSAFRIFDSQSHFGSP